MIGIMDRIALGLISMVTSMLTLWVIRRITKPPKVPTLTISRDRWDNPVQKGDVILDPKTGDKFEVTSTSIKIKRIKE